MTESAQFERDLRSANKEWRRGKDSSVKWSHGSRNLSGVYMSLYGDVNPSAPEHMLSKQRPEKRHSERNHTPKTSQNIVKARSAWDMPAARRRVQSHTLTELDAAIKRSDLPSPSVARTRTHSLSLSSSFPSLTPAPDAGVLYSFDRTDTPGRPLTLEVFVKPGSGRKAGGGAGGETEKLVEREYEVLDGNGEAVRGRRARAVLRKGASGSGKEKEEEGKGKEVEDGFELL
ncbi:uncharacterized protein C8A04DRAFT_26329 [Dichotomopilus funicola]|uniref:Uncharacterized protein n=1 Tax=Dichotomopilus funicola TaxID=1934379 RepID=A0AAN6ZNI4_9PEZI|nr:hypothetical protein C8A04DRAFT_26329 [Dichotomopilus funicola]